MNDVLEWVEKAALENLKFHLQTVEVLSKEANTTLTILIAALSGAFAFALNGGRFTAAAWILTVYLVALCMLLVTQCMMIREVPAPTNEPRNLNQEGYTLDALRRVELRNIQGRIDDVAHRNNITAYRLNCVRVGAILAPLVFTVGAFVVGAYSRGG